MAGTSRKPAFGANGPREEASDMRKSIFLVYAMGFLVAASAFGQNYRGTYASTSGGVTLTLVLEQDAAGRISGSL